jgi:cardiolipin synthase
VLLDSYGARTMDRDLITLLDAAGVHVRWFRPLGRIRIGEVNHRTHRKVMVVDEEIGFTGGVGIADEWRGDARGPSEWRDTHFRIRGPAVDGLRAAFLADWAETDRQLFDQAVDRFPEQPQPGTAIAQVCEKRPRPGGATSRRCSAACCSARTAHGSPPRTSFPTTNSWAFLGGATSRDRDPATGASCRQAIRAAGGRGDVRPLLGAGIRIWSYQPRCFTPGDDRRRTDRQHRLCEHQASPNQLDEEINVVVLDEPVVELLDSHFDEDLERSVEISAANNDRSLTQRAFRRLATPFRRLF